MVLKSKTKILFTAAIFTAIIFALSRVPNVYMVISDFLRGRVEVTIVKYFPFSTENSLKEWQEKILNKRVIYKVESLDNKSYVHAMSDRACSAMYYKIKLDAKKRPFISWKWRVNKFPDKGSADDLLSEEEDDFAARVYVIFPAIFFSKTKVLEYIWGEDLKVGTISSSPYSDGIKLIVAESGLREGARWVYEERDIYKDYLEAFGVEPKLKIRAVAFMCDSDSTESNADALFDDIKIFYKED